MPRKDSLTESFIQPRVSEQMILSVTLSGGSVQCLATTSMGPLSLCLCSQWSVSGTVASWGLILSQVNVFSYGLTESERSKAHFSNPTRRKSCKRTREHTLNTPSPPPIYSTFLRYGFLWCLFLVFEYLSVKN